MARVSNIEIRLYNSIVWESAPQYQSRRMFLLLKDTIEVRISLPVSGWKINSDVYGCLLERSN